MIKSILIIGRYDSMYNRDFLDVLRRNDYPVELLDLHNCFFYDQESKAAPLSAGLLGFLLKLPLIKYLSRIIISYLYLRKLCVKKNKYDVVNIFYFKYEYILYAKLFRRLAAKLVVSIFGSDYYGSRLKRLQTSLYDLSDVITFNNETRLKHFHSYHRNRYAEKTRLMYYGSRLLDEIDRLCQEIDDPRTVICGEFGIDPKSILIMCGTNSFKAQQHARTLQSIGGELDRMDKKITLVLPLTYGSSSGYKNRIGKLAKKYIRKHKIIIYKDYLSDEQVAKLRIITDILIQVQKSDALSGAMLQSLYCGALVVTGEWLSYPVLDSLGVYYQQITDFAELRAKITNFVENNADFRSKTGANRPKIEIIMKYDNIIPGWVRLYEE